jgi:hypothetical protein
MASKRKRDELRVSDTVHRPEPGTRSFTSGPAVRDGLAVGSRQGESEDKDVAGTPN